MAKILCIEDEPDFRDSIVDFLKEEGHEVTQAENGRQGLDALARNPFDLVVSDIGMPVMSGLEMLTEFRNRYPEKAGIPVIFLTAFGQKKDLMQGRVLGADDYLLKPVDFDLLHASIDAKLHRIHGLKHFITSELDSMRGQLLQMLMHELHSPITAIVGFSDMMNKEALGPIVNDKYKDFVSTINRAGHTLLSLVNNCLDTASLLANHHRPVAQDIDMEGMIWECLQAVKGEMGAGVKLIQQIDPDLPTLKGDRALLSRAIISLIQDAISHRPVSGAFRLSISLDGQQRLVMAFDDMVALEHVTGQVQEFPLRNPKDFLKSYLHGFIDINSSNMRFLQAVMHIHDGWMQVRVSEGEILGLQLIFPGADWSVSSESCKDDEVT